MTRAEALARLCNATELAWIADGLSHQSSREADNSDDPFEYVSPVWQLSMDVSAALQIVRNQ